MGAERSVEALDVLAYRTRPSAAGTDASWSDLRAVTVTDDRTLTEFQTSGLDAVERIDIEQAANTVKQLKRFAKQLKKQENKLGHAQDKLAQAQQDMANAAEELAAALLLEEGKAKQKAISKANKKLNKAAKKIAKFTHKIALYSSNIEALTDKILDLDPFYFDEDPVDVDGPGLEVQTNGIDEILYSWTPVADATSYTLYLDVTPGVQPETGFPFSTGATSFLIQDVPAGLSVYGVVTATVEGIETQPSTEVGVSLSSLPASPTNLHAIAGSTTVVVSWTPVAGANSYNLYWSTSPGVSPGNGNLVANVSTPFTHTGLASGQTYYYVVTALNPVGMSQKSAQTAATIVSGGPQNNDGSPLGVNLHAITYWSPEWVFKDVFKQSKPWYPQEANSGAWDTGFDLTVNADGYPILGTNPAGNPEAAGTLIFRDLEGHYPSGEYLCLYDGQGDVEVGMDAVATDVQPGRIVFRVDNPSNGGIFLKIASTPNPANPVHNIRIFQSQWEDSYQSEPFHPAFLQRLAPFKMMRFMDWQRTNHNDFLQHWSDRATPGFQTQGSPERGVALEHMIQLSNTLHADPWFCIPHLATDDFVHQFAVMCRDTLNPDLKLYIEHSNEVWNGAFGQAQYAVQVGLALGLADNDFQAQLRYHAQRSIEIFEIFEQVFGGTDRLIRVIGSQSDNPWVGTTVMDWANAHEHADALAVAPYWDGGLTDNPSVANMSVAQVLDICESDIEDTKLITEQNAANAAARGLTLIAYEGGQHLTPKANHVNNQAMVDKFIAVNRAPGMFGLYTQDLNNWAEAGGGMYAIFSSMSVYSKWGSWGVMEYEDQDLSTAPKYQACVQFVADQASN